MRIQCTCSVCGKAFSRWPSHVGPHCSIQCTGVAHRGRSVGSSIVVINDEMAKVPLHGRGGVVRAYAIIDTADAEWAGRWRWVLTAQGYASRAIERLGHKTSLPMHRELLGLVPGDGLEGDHINRDRLDNRRSNLRIVTRQGNGQNLPSMGGHSRFRGVTWDKRRGKWYAQASMSGKHIYFGTFATEEEAAEAARAGRIRLMPYANN